MGRQMLSSTGQAACTMRRRLRCALASQIIIVLLFSQDWEGPDHATLSSTTEGADMTCRPRAFAM